MNFEKISSVESHRPLEIVPIFSHNGHVRILFLRLQSQAQATEQQSLSLADLTFAKLTLCRWISTMMARSNCGLSRTKNSQDYGAPGELSLKCWSTEYAPGLIMRCQSLILTCDVLQGYAISDEEVAITRDQFHEKFMDRSNRSVE